MKLKIQVSVPPFIGALQRKWFATFLAGTIEGESLGFVPYQPNKTDDTYFIIDRNNDWRLSFFEDDPSSFEIKYRYQCAEVQAEEALAAWLKYRVNAVPV